MNCYYHPDRAAVGMCVTCGKAVCMECKVVLGEKIHCNPCADEHFSEASTAAAQGGKKEHYSTTLRILCGIFGAFIILGSIAGLSYYLESGLVAELVMDIVSIIIAVFLFTLTISPRWVSRIFRIKLEKGWIYSSVLIALLVVYFVAVTLGPEPPGGWWDYGGPLIEM